MKINIAWDKYEVAMLIDLYLSTQMVPPHEKSIAISKLSRDLRNYALKRSIEIELNYRNVTGIKMRLSNIAYLFSNGATGLSGYSKMDKIMYDLYNTDKAEYIRILQEAKEMIVDEPIKSNKDAFILWLTDKVPPKKLSTTLSAVDDIDSFCKKIKVTNKNFFEIDDVFELTKVKKAIDGNLLFKLTHKGKMPTIHGVIKCYNNFIEEKKANSMNVTSIVDEKHIETVIVSAQDNITEASVSDFDKDKGSIRTSRVLNVQNDNQSAFLKWMIEVDNSANSTARSYSSAMKTISEYGLQWGLIDISLLNIVDSKQLSNIINTLFNDDRFVALNDKQHNRYRAALNKYYTFISGDAPVRASSSNSITDNKNIHKYELLLSSKFRNGFRLNSSLQTKKLRGYYVEQFLTVATESDDEIQKIMKDIGIVYGERVYSPVSMLNEEIKSDIFDYISCTFAEGISLIYYDAIYTEFENDLQMSNIYNTDMLKCYLEYNNKGQFYVRNAFITKDCDNDIDPIDEVRRFMKNFGTVASYDDVEEYLSHIPLQKVKQIFAFNPEFIFAKRNHYIHIDCVYFSDVDLNDIREILAQIIDRDGFASGNELINSIAKLHPEIIDNNAAIADSVAGLRDSIKYHLAEYFNFNGNIISKLGSDLSMADIYAEYCTHHDTFTIEALNVLKNELGSTIYFDAVYDNSLRISETEFVYKGNTSFDVATTDEAIKIYCVNDYIPITGIKQFALFPSTDFPWNSYILEHYVYAHSAVFKLIHAASFSATKCAGVIVKRTSRFESFEEIIVDALARSNIVLNKANALNYLYDNGYIGKRNLSYIDKVIEDASLQRSRKE